MWQVAEREGLLELFFIIYFRWLLDFFISDPPICPPILATSYFDI